MMHRSWDAIVIGCGAMGSFACAWLARRGASVLGIEQFTRGHDRGSSHGGSRVVRETYFESPEYVPLVRRALTHFEELEEVSGESLLHRCGVLYCGNPGGAVMAGVRASAATHGIPIDEIDVRDLERRFPMFAPPPGSSAIFEPGAGFVRPERCVRAALHWAEGLGAVIQEGEKVERIEESGRTAVVETDAGRYEASAVVLAGGAWTHRCLAALVPYLRVTRQTIAWIDPGGNGLLADERSCPAWFIEDGPRGPFYGIPTARDQEGPSGLKVARHVPGAAADPDGARAPVSDAERADLEDAMRRLAPGVAGAAHATATCLYTMSPDEHFIIDRAPGLRRTFVACGFSGHGFKFAPVVGEILADLALNGSTRLPCDFLRADRLRRSIADPAEHP